MMSAMALAALICLILLPAISASDDMMVASQAGLPLSQQTWRMMSEDFSAGVELPPIDLFLVLLICLLTATGAVVERCRSVRQIVGRIVVSQRLRPPPSVAH
jgi:hypothetical protein